MTARRVAAHVAALVVFAAVWSLAAWRLWQSKLPSGLHLGGLNVHAYFNASEIRRAASFGTVSTWTGIATLLATLAVLAAYARWGARFSRESAAGRIGTGMLLGMLGLGLTWFAQIPFGVFQLWWLRRHHLAEVGYFEYVLSNWLSLGGEFLFISLALLIVMALARPLGDRWWIAGAPVFVGLALLFTFVQPWLIPNTHRLGDPTLAAAARTLERREGVAPTPIDVQKVSADTSAPNAEATGMGPSRRVILWDTLLDGRFTDREIKVVMAHELGHLKRHHLWKQVGWYALFAIPGAFLIALATRRRGGMLRPEAVPVGLFVFILLSTLAIPIQNVITRHIEAEADWMALTYDRDPTAQKALMKQFTRTALAEPDPDVVDYLLFENHPTVMQRIAEVEWWQKHIARR